MLKIGNVVEIVDTWFYRFISHALFARCCRNCGLFCGLFSGLLSSWWFSSCRCCCFGHLLSAHGKDPVIMGYEISVNRRLERILATGSLMGQNADATVFVLDQRSSFIVIARTSPVTSCII